MERTNGGEKHDLFSCKTLLYISAVPEHSNWIEVDERVVETWVFRQRVLISTTQQQKSHTGLDFLDVYVYLYMTLLYRDPTRKSCIPSQRSMRLSV